MCGYKNWSQLLARLAFDEFRSGLHKGAKEQDSLRPLMIPRSQSQTLNMTLWQLVCAVLMQSCRNPEHQISLLTHSIIEKTQRSHTLSSLHLFYTRVCLVHQKPLEQTCGSEPPSQPPSSALAKSWRGLCDRRAVSMRPLRRMSSLSESWVSG
jgi:hypothetical protein